MRKPYYTIKAVCINERCDMGTFYKERKKIVRIGTDGRPYQTANVVCPRCGTWANIIHIERVE